MVPQTSKTSKVVTVNSRAAAPGTPTRGPSGSGAGVYGKEPAAPTAVAASSPPASPARAKRAGAEVVGEASEASTGERAKSYG